MTTKAQPFAWCLVAWLVLAAAPSALALGSDYPNGQPITGATNWPNGLDRLVNATNRVGGFWVNAEDVFFFGGDAAQFTSFLRDYARLEGVRQRRLILHPGSGSTKAPWGYAGRPCDWKLYACPQGWHNAATLLREGTNSTAGIQQAAREPGYVLEVHFWTGGRIALDQVQIPASVTVTNAP